MHWYHTTEVIELQTPSRNDGIDYETEARYRKEGARFIMELGNKLGLRYLTMATGIVFFHRFYMFHSFKEFSRWVTGASCLFLAGKVEETPKKCRDVLKVAQQSLTDKHFKTFGENPREEVMICERIILQTIKFDLQTSHPYQYLIKYGKLLKGEKSKINELVQKAWIFINDSLSTTLCLLYKPQVIAIAVLLLAFKMSNQNIRDFISKPRVDWWKTFHVDATEADLEDICKELMNMYEGKPPRRRFPHKHSGVMKKKSSPLHSESPKAKKQKTTDSSSAAVVISTPLSSNHTSNTSIKKSVVGITAGETAQDSKQSAALSKTFSISSSLNKDLERQKQEHKHFDPTIKSKVQNQHVLTPQLSYADQVPNPTQMTTPVNTQSLNIQTSTHQSQQNVQAPQQLHQVSHVQMDVSQKSATLSQAPILDHMSSFFQSNPSYNFMAPPAFPQPPFAPLIPPTFSQQAPQPQQNYPQNNYQTPGSQNQEYQSSAQQSQSSFQPGNQHKQLGYQTSQQPPGSYQASAQQNPNNYQVTNQPTHHNFLSQQSNNHQPNFMNSVPSVRNIYQNNSYCNYAGGAPPPAPPASPFAPQSRMPQHVPPPFPPGSWLGNPGTPPANSNKPPWMQ